MFNIFKKKRNKLDNAIIVKKYVLNIHYKNDTMNSFINDGDTLPLDYRKLLN